EAVEDGVQGLFTDETHSELASGVDQAKIDEMTEMLDWLPTSDRNTELQGLVQVAQELLDSATLNSVETAVNELFTDETHSELASEVDQAKIDEVKAMVDNLPDSDRKTELQSLVQVAQELLDSATLNPVETAVNELFTDETHSELASGVDQAKIDEVKAMVDNLPDSDKKTELQSLVQVAQELLDTVTENPITVNEYIEGRSSYVTGTYTVDNVAFMRVEVNGEKKPLIRPTTPGSFSYYIRGLKTTDTVEYVLFNASYKEIARQTVTVSSGTSVAITNIDQYIEGTSSYVTGTYTGVDNVAFMRVEVNGEKKPLIRPTTPGSFSYYIRGLKTTDTVEYVLFDASYKEITRQTVTVSRGTSVAITNINQYTEGFSSYVTGTYTGVDNVAFMRVEVNGEKKPLIRPTTPGSFSYYIRGLKTTDTVEYVLFNASYVEVARSTVEII
ncbi:toxin Cry1Ac domain D-VI-related protein, partial [Enterococcus faecium]|uniref:toxin Cry1Ac domain D-VI-related protein n=1 Tax=Enterococcus faecium TaxID=1352 RepID=UPI0023B2424C